MSTRETLRTFVADNFLFGQIPGNFSDDSSFLEGGIIDSTGVLELVSFLEQRFEIRIQDDEIVPDNLDSVNTLAGFVERKLAAREAEAVACS